MKPFEEKMPRLVAELHVQFAPLLSPWERLGEGVSTQEKLTNLKGLGYGV